MAALIDGEHCHLVVDLEQVEFFDSTGLGVFVGALKRIRASGGSLQLVCTQERVLTTFRITGLDSVFGFHNDVDAAIAAIGAHSRAQV